jgi:hypothetical protein
LACGVIGPLLFIGATLVEGATRPGYDAWRHLVSSLALGPQGWEQTANMLLFGTLVLAFAVGLRRVLLPGVGSTWAPILVGIVGLSIIGIALFPIDPAFGYPPGAPSVSTLHGTLHEVFDTLSVVALLAACIILARRFWRDPVWRGWAVYSLATVLLLVAFVVVRNVADSSAATGLFQRVSVIVAWGWIALLAGGLLRKDAPVHQ